MTVGGHRSGCVGGGREGLLQVLQVSEATHEPTVTLRIRSAGAWDGGVTAPARGICGVTESFRDIVRAHVIRALQVAHVEHRVDRGDLGEIHVVITARWERGYPCGPAIVSAAIGRDRKGESLGEDFVGHTVVAARGSRKDGSGGSEVTQSTGVRGNKTKTKARSESSMSLSCHRIMLRELASCGVSNNDDCLKVGKCVLSDDSVDDLVIDSKSAHLHRRRAVPAICPIWSRRSFVPQHLGWHCGGVIWYLKMWSSQVDVGCIEREEVLDSIPCRVPVTFSRALSTMLHKKQNSHRGIHHTQILLQWTIIGERGIDGPKD